MQCVTSDPIADIVSICDCYFVASFNSPVLIAMSIMNWNVSNNVINASKVSVAVESVRPDHMFDT